MAVSKSYAQNGPLTVSGGGSPFGYHNRLAKATRVLWFNNSEKEKEVNTFQHLNDLGKQPFYALSQKNSYFVKAVFNNVPPTKNRAVQTENRNNHKTNSEFLDTEKHLLDYPEDTETRLEYAWLLEERGEKFEALEQFRLAKAIKKFKKRRVGKQLDILNPLLRNHEIKWNFMPMFAGDADFTHRRFFKRPLKFARAACVAALLAFAAPFPFTVSPGNPETPETNKEVVLTANQSENRSDSRNISYAGFSGFLPESNFAVFNKNQPVTTSHENKNSLTDNSLTPGYKKLLQLLGAVMFLVLMVFAALFLQSPNSGKSRNTQQNKLLWFNRRKFLRTGLTFALGAGVIGIRSASAIDSDSALPDSATIPTNLAKDGLNVPNSYSTRYKVIMDKEGDKPTVEITNISDNLTFDYDNIQPTGNPKEFTFDLNLYTGNNNSIEDLALEVKREIPDGIFDRPAIRDDLKIDYNGQTGQLRYQLGTHDSDVRVELIDIPGRTNSILYDGPGYQGENTVDGLPNSSSMVAGMYLIKVTTSEGHNTLKFIPGRSGTNMKQDAFSTDSFSTKSASTDSLEQAIINVNAENLTTRTPEDPYIGTFVTGSKPAIYVTNGMNPNHNYELVGMSDNVKDWGFFLDSPRIRGPTFTTPEQSQQVVHFDIKAPDYEGAPSGITQRITQWLSRYETKIRLDYAKNGVDASETIKIPDYVAGLLMEHEGWNPEGVDFAEYTARSRIADTASFESLMTKLHEILTDPQYSEQKAWLKNLNTDYELRDDVWVNTWYEKVDLITQLSDDPLKVDELYPGGAVLTMKDHAEEQSSQVSDFKNAMPDAVLPVNLQNHNNQPGSWSHVYLVTMSKTNTRPSLVAKGLTGGTGFSYTYKPTENSREFEVDVRLTTGNQKSSSNITIEFYGTANTTKAATKPASIKSGTATITDAAIINIDSDSEIQTTRQLGDNFIPYSFAGFRLFAYIRNENPTDFTNFELVGMSDNVKDAGYMIDPVENRLRGPPAITPEQSQQIVHFDIKAPDYEGAPSGITQRITHWLSRYETKIRLDYARNGEDASETIKIPDYVAGLLMEHEGWNPEGVDFAEYTTRDRVADTANFESLMTKLHDIMTNPQYSEQKAWLKNINTDYELQNEEWVNTWYEKADLLTQLGTSPMVQDELYARGIKINMKDHA